MIRPLGRFDSCVANQDAIKHFEPAGVLRHLWKGGWELIVLLMSQECQEHIGLSDRDRSCSPLQIDKVIQVQTAKRIAARTQELILERADEAATVTMEVDEKKHVV